MPPVPPEKLLDRLGYSVPIALSCKKAFVQYFDILPTP